MANDVHEHRVSIAPRTIGLIALLVGATWLAARLWMVILVVVVALMLVGTFDPMVSWIERRGLRRGRALIVIFFAMAALVAVLVFVTLPPLFSELLQLVDNAPKERASIVAFLASYRWADPAVKAINSIPIDSLVATAGKALLGYSSDILEIIGYAVTTIFLAIYLLADPKRSAGVLYAIVPRSHHVKLARILIELETIVGGYMRGQLITSVSIAVFMFAMLTILGVDNALSIAIFAGMTDVIPFVGGILASAPAVLATVSLGAGPTIAVGVLCILYQEFENRILVPRVYGRTLRLAPAVVLIALFVGGILLGVLGALLALPIAAGLQMLVHELRVELPGNDHADEATRLLDEKAEQIYATVSAGCDAEDAGVLAGELAQRMKEQEERGVPLTTAEIPAVVIELVPPNV